MSNLATIIMTIGILGGVAVMIIATTKPNKREKK